jgi:hypothetical protein
MPLRLENERATSEIVLVEAYLCDIAVVTKRTDAIQAFLKQETIFVEIETEDGIIGIGYSYTIGTGGRAVLELLRADLIDKLLGEDARQVEALWQKMFWAIHATAVGAITSMALAAIDTALWDIRCLAAGQPLWLMAGGARQRVPLYDTEGGWLHLTTEELIAGALLRATDGLPPYPVENVSATARNVRPPSNFLWAYRCVFHLCNSPSRLRVEGARRRRTATGDPRSHFCPPLGAESASIFARLRCKKFLQHDYCRHAGCV